MTTRKRKSTKNKFSNTMLNKICQTCEGGTKNLCCGHVHLVYVQKTRVYSLDGWVCGGVFAKNVNIIAKFDVL